MISEKVIAIGKFKPKDLIVSFRDSTRRIDTTIENKVDEIWEATLLQAKIENKNCFNGITYRLNSYKVIQDKLILDFGTLEYKVRQSLTMIPKYFSLPEEYFHKGAYSGSTVKTSDNRYLVVEMSGKSMNHNRYDLLGGIMEKPSEIASKGEQVFECMYKELEEEAHIYFVDIKECYLRSITLTSKTYTSFYYEVSLNISSQDILNRFSEMKNDEDIKSLKAFSREEYIDFLKSHSSKHKQYIATILAI